MKKHQNRKSAKSEVEALELRQHMSATSFVGGVLTLQGNATQNNTFTVRDVSYNSGIYGTANNQGQIAPESQVKKVVVYTGDKSDTVSVNSNSPFAVEVISTTGAVSWVQPGKTETFEQAAATTGDANPNTDTGGGSGSSNGSSDSGNGSSSSSSSGTSGSSGSTSGNTGSSGSTGSTNSSNVDTPNPVITFTSNSTVLPDESVNVQALASTFGDSDVLHSTITWNFGDPGSAYNQLVGFNAAHAYASPGVYTITLTISTPDGHSADATTTVTVSPDTRTTIYVSTDGSDSNSGLSANDPIQSIARADQLMTNNTRILFERGDTFDTTNPSAMLDNYDNVYIGAYGTGASPILMYTGAKVEGAIISSTASSKGLTVEGLTFDSIYTHNMDVGSIPYAIAPSGSDIAILNNTFYNVQCDVTLYTGPSNVLVQGNSSPDPQALNGYFCWVQGNDIVVVGNTVADSTGESIVRVGGANRVLIAENDLSSTIKASIAIQLGSYAYVYDNVIPAGPMGVGPLYNTLPSSLADVDGQFNYCVFDSNQIWGAILVQPAAHYTLARNNVIYGSGGGTGFVINATTSLFPNRQAQYIYLLDNTVYDASQQGGFLSINNGQALGVVVDNNSFIDPDFVTGAGSGIIYVPDDNLDSFSQIQDNVWPVAKPIMWANGGVFYMDEYIGVQSGYLTPAEWEATGVPTGDVYENVTPTGTQSVTADGFTAGSNLPIESTPTQTMEDVASHI